LRQATLAGGALLSTPAVAIEVAVPRYEGKILAVDYLERKVTVSGAIPAGWLAGSSSSATINIRLPAR